MRSCLKEEVEDEELALSDRTEWLQKVTAEQITMYNFIIVMLAFCVGMMMDDATTSFPIKVGNLLFLCEV